jgi:hypothetical protein
MNEAISYFIRKSADWLFRKRSPALYTARCGFFLLSVALVGSWAMFVTYHDKERFFEFNYHSSNVGSFFLLSGFMFGCIAFVGGILWEFKRYSDESKLKARKKTIVIEQRGLIDTADKPLDTFISSNLNKNTDSIVNDIRERIVDNVVTRPDVALRKLEHLARDIQVRKEHLDSNDVTIAYGGIMPVPFAFFTGYILDDETAINLYDWCRDESNWKTLDEEDDNEQFIIEHNPCNAKEAIVAISFSYLVDKQSIQSEFLGKQIHYLTLDKRHRNNHWSKKKQNRLAGDFFEYCKYLQDKGVEHIHLVLAAQNSVAFRFGQAYDKRNLPNLTIYQYEKHSTPKYKWGVSITPSEERNVIITSDSNEVAA